MEGYAILCDARKGGQFGINCLALVDRNKTKKLWWTSDDEHLIMIFKKKSAAQFTLNKLMMNSPCISSADDAINSIKLQREQIDHHEASAENEMGWDGHKTI